MWDLPGPGIEPVSPALAGRFLTAVPPGKSLFTFSIWNMYFSVWDSHHFFNLWPDIFYDFWKLLTISFQYYFYPVSWESTAVLFTVFHTVSGCILYFPSSGLSTQMCSSDLPSNLLILGVFKKHFSLISFIYLYIYLFIFGCVGSSLLRADFL